MNTHKTCIRCLTAYPRTPEYFYRNKSYLRYGEKDGLQPYCKECDDDKRSQRYTEHIDEELERATSYRNSNPEKVRESMNNWRANNREKYNEYLRKYRKELK